MNLQDLDSALAEEVVNNLRNGIPPSRHTSLYSVGNERFLENVSRRHLNPENSHGKIHFVAGSWGSGKTHFFRLLTERAFDAGYLVSTVELNAQQTPFHKFALVLASIVRNIQSPGSDELGSLAEPFGSVLHEVLSRETKDAGDVPTAIANLKRRLFADQAIDVDVKRIVAAYWDTFATESDDTVVLEDRRGLLLQWFSGEANRVTMRKEFEVQKLVTKVNARLILQSLVALVRFLGYRGLVVLFDESEMTHSTARRPDLKQLHSNLLHLINEVDKIAGVILVYAAVPEFFNDEKTGIVIYGALAGRVGRIPDHAPRAIETVWNLDAIEIDIEDYVGAASRIRAIYERAYPDDVLLSEADLRSRVATAAATHSPFSATSRWRLVIKETTKLLDLSLEGIDPPDPAESVNETIGMLQRLGDD